MMKILKGITAVLFLVFMASCTNDSEDDLIDAVDDPVGGGTTALTYTNDIAPIVQSACLGCHASPPVNGAPSSFVGYTQVEQRASAMLARMQLQNGAPGAMPPSGRLPQATIDAVEQWINEGKIEN